MLFFQVLLLAGYVYAHLLQRWFSPRKPGDRPPGRGRRRGDGAAGPAGRRMAAAGRLEPGLADPVAAGRHGRAALLRPVGDEPLGADLVQRLAARPLALSAVCLVELGLVGRAAELSAGDRAGARPAKAAVDVDRGLSVVWRLLAAALACVWRLGLRKQDLAIQDALSGHATQSACSTWLDRLIWLALPALASLMLLASTNHVCQDVAVVPLLWVVPLALYLLSFIICFDHARWYVRPVWATAAVLALLGGVFIDCFNDSRLHFGLIAQLAIYFTALFCACMVCHGELVRASPTRGT